MFNKKTLSFKNLLKNDDFKIAYSKKKELSENDPFSKLKNFKYRIILANAIFANVFTEMQSDRKIELNDELKKEMKLLNQCCVLDIISIQSQFHDVADKMSLKMLEDFLFQLSKFSLCCDMFSNAILGKTTEKLRVSGINVENNFNITLKSSFIAVASISSSINLEKVLKVTGQDIKETSTYKKLNAVRNEIKNQIDNLEESDVKSKMIQKYNGMIKKSNEQNNESYQKIKNKIINNDSDTILQIKDDPILSTEEIIKTAKDIVDDGLTKNGELATFDF